MQADARAADVAAAELGPDASEGRDMSAQLLLAPAGASSMA